MCINLVPRLIRIPPGEGGARNTVREGSFKVTRMRCWRISSVEPSAACEGGAGPSCSAGPAAAHLELSFEYLMSRQQLQWVRLASPQAVLMSICLQALVEELLRRRKGLGIPRVSHTEGLCMFICQACMVGGDRSQFSSAYQIHTR